MKNQTLLLELIVDWIIALGDTKTDEEMSDFYCNSVDSILDDIYLVLHGEPQE